MRLAWVIFRKDMRRLWWEVSVATGSLVYFSYLDAQRFDYVAGPMDGLLNLVIPAAWAYIIGLAVLQEAPAGDREFWRTRPYPRWSLLAAKALLVVVCVHLPYLAACAAVLAAHGFSPIDGASQLGLNQVAVAALVSLPALAVASVSRNLPQFIIAAITIAMSGFLVVSQSLDSGWAVWRSAATNNRVAAIGLTSVTALAVAGLQYLRNRTGYARSLGVAGAIGAGALCGLLPHDPFITKRLPERRFKLNLQRATFSPGLPSGGSAVMVTEIPLELTGAPRDLYAEFSDGGLTISTTRGREVRVEPPPRSGSSKPRGLHYFLYPASPSSQHVRTVLRIASQSSDPDLSSAPVRVSGFTVVRFYEDQAPSILSVGGERYDASAGRCRAGLEEMPNMGQAKLIKVYCESARSIPERVRLEVKSRAGGPWRRRLGDSMPAIPYFWNIWLSPLDRRQTFFPIADEPSSSPGDQWLVSKDALPSAWIELTSVKAIGQQRLTFRLDGVQLK